MNPEIIPPQGSRDYARLVTLMQKTSVICIVDYMLGPCRDVARTLFQRDEDTKQCVYQVCSRGRGYLLAESPAEFIDRCQRLNLEFLEPSDLVVQDELTRAKIQYVVNNAPGRKVSGAVIDCGEVVAVVHKSAVRWLVQEEMQTLMHPGSDGDRCQFVMPFDGRCTTPATHFVSRITRPVAPMLVCGAHAKLFQEEKSSFMVKPL